MKTFVLLTAVFAQVPGFELILPTYAGDFQEGNASSTFSPTGLFQAGRATYYGPNPKYPPGNEAGYRKLDVGVACSDGRPGGDPKWNAILKRGVKPNSLDPDNVWPTSPTVAVSEAAWGKSLCWQTVVIRSKANPSKMITATVVDLCPAAGCLWDKSERAFNVDLYGIDSFQELGGDEKGGKIDLEIKWPAGFMPKNSANYNGLSLLVLSLLLISAFF